MAPSFNSSPSTTTTNRMVAKGTSLILLLTVLIQDSMSNPDNICRNAVAPPSKPRGVNQVDRTSATPLFELQLIPIDIRENTGDLTGYKVSITTAKGKPSHFSQATLAVSTNGSCGSGDFDFRVNDYMEIVQDQGEQCPRLIQTRRKTLMTELLPLIWIPPTCGCITLRVLLIESGDIYYAENEAVTNGPLAKTICFGQPQPAKISRDDRLASLCHVIDKHSSGEILSRHQFQRDRELEARWMDHIGLEMALELRRNDARTCCQKIKYEDKMECFDDARRRRIDQFCEDGIPDIPFRTFRRTHMRTLEKSCCFILGEFRYKCFAQNSKMAAGEEKTNLFDYSMDASDIVNDLAEFGSHEHLDFSLRPRQFGNDENDDNEDDDQDDDGMEFEFDDEEEDEDENFESREEADDDEDLYPTSHLQRTPPKTNRGKYDLQNPLPASAASSSSIPTTTSNTRRTYASSSQKELKKQMRRKSKSRNSQEKRRMTSAERKNRRGGGGRRKSVRRGSAENRVGSAERRYRQGQRPQVPYDDGYNTVRSSKERETFIQSGFDEAETRGNDRSKFTKARSDRRGSDSRKPMSFDKDLMLPSQYGFDDQEDSAMDRTIIKLQKRMKRLKLLNMCCQAGSDAGGHVYGGIGSVTNECRHSSDKFVRGVRLGGKTRKCAAQFVDCCIEEAKKGLTMTSQEFIENTRVDYWDNPQQQYDPRLVGRVLAQRGRRPSQSVARPDSRRPTNTRENMKDDYNPAPKNKPNERRFTFEDRFETVEEGKSIPQPSKTPKRTGTSSVQISSQDLDKDSRGNIPVTSNDPVANGGSRKTVNGGFEARKQISAKEEVRSSDNHGKMKSGSDAMVSEISKRKSVASRPFESTRKAIRENDFLDDVVDRKGNSDHSKSRNKNGGYYKSPTTGKPPIDDGIQGVPAIEERIGKPTVEITDSIESKSASEGVQKEKVSQQQPIRTTDKSTLLSKIQSNGQTHKESGTDERTRAREQNIQKNGYKSTRKAQGRRKFKSKIVALDSREMAERNTKQYRDALDSREMADQFVSNNKNNRRGRWFRKGIRNYKYATPSFTNRRRSRFG